MNLVLDISLTGTFSLQERADSVASQARLARARATAEAPLHRNPDEVLEDFRNAIIASEVIRAKTLRAEYLASGGRLSTIIEVTREINPDLVRLG